MNSADFIVSKQSPEWHPDAEVVPATPQAAQDQGLDTGSTSMQETSALTLLPRPGHVRLRQDTRQRDTVANDGRYGNTSLEPVLRYGLW